MSRPPPTLVLATANPHKIEELSALFRDLQVRLIGLREAAGGEPPPEPAETGSTFEENAGLKAAYYAQRVGELCLADDSGLEIDALGGKPGVISSHYCTDGRVTGMTRAERDAANNDRVLRELDGVPAEQRSARFVCVMALADGRSSAPPTPPCGTGMLPVSTRPTPSRSSPQTSSPPTISPALETHQRNLPHWQYGGSTYFITFRLRRGQLDNAERQIVIDAIFHWHYERWIVELATVMPDHVHALVRPLNASAEHWFDLADLVRSVKHFSARRINERRQEQGSVWQDEYHDRIVRDEREFGECAKYIWENPVAAGLVRESWEYPFLDDGRRWEETQRRLGRHGQHARATRAGRGRGEGSLSLVRGTFKGRIGQPGEVPRGANGFGYDPLFLVAPDFKVTSAELSPGVKNRVSHRGDAARKMIEHLRSILV